MRVPASCALALLLGGAVARAQGADPDTVANREAREAFLRGSMLFNVGRFDEALEEFREAYSLSQAPGLLFNMGQACRAQRRYDLATYYYRAYLRLSPDAAQRPYVEERLREIASLESAPATPKTPVPVVPDASVADAPARPDPEDAGRGWRMVGLATAGAGVALAGTALWFGKAASDASDEVSRAFRDGAVYDDELASRYAAGRRNERIAIISGAVGATFAIGGTVLYWVGVRERARARVAVAPAPHGAAVEASWRF